MKDNNPKNKKINTNFTLAPEFEKNFKPGTLDTFGEQGVVHTTFGNTDFGESQYDKDNLSSEFIKNNDYQYLRGERQGFGAELANAVGGGLAKIPFTIIGNTASMLDFEDYFNTDNEVGNAITAWAEEMKGNINEATPIYKSNDNHLTSREWWMSNINDLIDSAGSFALTGAGLGKGVQLLSNLAKGSKAVQQAIGFTGTITNAAMLNQAESIPIAMDVYKSAKLLGKTDEEAADAAAYSIAINRLNIPLNVTSAGAFLRPIQTTRQVAKDFSKKQVLERLASEGSQEYLEENINNIAENEAKLKAKQGKDYTYDFNRTVNDVLSKEGFESGLIGFLGGMIQTGGTELIKSYQKDSPSYDENGNIRYDENNNPILVTPQQSQKERFKAQQKSLSNIELLGKTEGVPTVKETLDKIRVTSDLLNDIQEASLNNDVETVDKLKNQLLTNQALDAFKNGSTEQLIDLYKSISNDPTSKDKYGKDVAVKSQEAIKQIEDLEKIYNSFGTLPQVDDVFNNRSERYYLVKHYDDLKKEQYDALLNQSKEIEITGYTKPSQIATLSSTQDLLKVEAKINNLKTRVSELDNSLKDLLSDDYTKKAQEESTKDTKPTEEDINTAFGVNDETETVDNTKTTFTEPEETNQPFEIPTEDILSEEDFADTTEKTPVSEEEAPIAKKKDDAREIYPGLNSDLRDKFNLPKGNVVRHIASEYTKQGVDINDNINLRPYVNSKGANTAIVSIKGLDGNYIDIGNLNSYSDDAVVNTAIETLFKNDRSMTPKELGIYYYMTDKVIQLENKETKQPNLSELTTDVTVKGDYLIYDRNNAGWANPYYDDTQLEIKPDFEDIAEFNKKELNNSRFVLLVPNGNKYSYVRLRNELLSDEDIKSLFNDIKDKSIEFKDNKDLSVDEISAFNESIANRLFVALNPDLKVGQTSVNGSELFFKVGKFGKFQAELRYKVGKDYKSITEYINISDTNDMNDLLGLINKAFKDNHETDLNLKQADLQQHVDLSKPETFRAATTRNVFNPNYGNQLRLNELNTEEQPIEVQLAKAVEPAVEKTDDSLSQADEDEEFPDLDNIQYSIGEETVDTITEKEINEIKKIIPSFIDVQDIKTIITNLKVNGIPYGAFRKNIIYLNSIAKKGTGYHEAFHSVFRTVLSEQDIQKYLKAAKNEFKGDLKASKETLLLTNPANSKLTNKELEELVYEEYLADKFADYVVNKSDKSIGATLKQLFRKIVELFKGLFNNTDSSTVLFDKILAGAFVNSEYQFNRFNGNNTAFKLLPRSYNKADGLRYFTAGQSRLLINTLTAKIHKAILNGDSRKTGEIFDDLAKQRYEELENDGFAFVDKLVANGDNALAEKVSAQIEEQQFILSPDSMKGQAYGLLKSEVLKRLDLFVYTDKDNDMSEDKEDGDDIVDNDNNEIKEQFGSKDAWLSGGHDSLSKTIKSYIAFTTYTKIDPLTGKETEYGIDEVTLYNGLIRILSDTKEDNMLDKLSVVAESNDNIKAFLNRITKEMNIGVNEDGSFNTINITPEAYNTFRLFVSNFKKSKAAQLMTTYKSDSKEDYKVFNANTNDPKKVSRDQWFNALYFIKENNKLTNKQLGDYIKDANKSLIIGNNPKDLKFLTNEDLNKQANDLVNNLSKVGIDISKVYAKYSIVKAKLKAIEDYNLNNSPILPSSVISDKGLLLNKLYNVTPITSDLLVGNNGYNLSKILTDGDNPYDGDKDINTRLEEIADANSYFDESIGNSSFTNAEGNRVYEIINLSYTLDKVNDFRNDAYWEKVKSGKGLTEVESKNFKFISGNYLLNNHYDALKRIELNIDGGFRNEADTEGITFGSYDERTYFANALALFAKTTKGGLVRYMFRQNEASNTAYIASAPKINALNAKGGLDNKVKDAFYNKFLAEFNRIATEFADKDNQDKQIIKGYNDSVDKGRAYKFTEFSYLAFIEPELYNNLTRMAQEGNFDELKANENKVKNAIEYYLLQEGYGRFKLKLETIGFITPDNNFIPKELITTYGSIDNALKEFYINDYLMSSSINELLDGDYALSRATKGFKEVTVNGVKVTVPKNAYGIDISKRNKGGMASGPDYGKGEHTVAYIKDINKYVVAKSVDGTLIRVEKTGDVFTDVNGNTYTSDEVKDITTNDAQSYASQYHHIFGSMRLGRLDKRGMNIYKDLIQFTKRDAEGNIIRNTSIPEVDQEYLESSLATANSKKTITFDGIAGIYHKLSEAGLWRSSISYIADEDVDTFVEYTNAINILLEKDRTDGKVFKDLVSELVDLYKPIPGMEYLHNLANKMDKGGIDQVVTESASKGSTIKPVDSFDGDLTKSITKVRNNAKRLQTETPTGKDVITAGSQLINLIDTELDDNHVVEGYGTLGDIRKTYRRLMADTRDNSFKQAMKYVTIFDDGSIDITKLREKLVRALEANNADESMMELFDKGYNLNLSAIIDKAEQIVLAHFSKGVLNQKVNGTKVSLMSDAGIEVVRNEAGDVVGIHKVLRNPNKYQGYTTSKLKYNVKGKDGRRFSECMLSERILTKHGLKIGDELPQELFEAIGYRIPTQGHQSMMALKVVGLLPNYYEGVGIFPQEIVYLSGADFDIDSEFIQLPQFWINKNGEAVVYGTEIDDSERWNALKYYNLNYNKEFKAEYKKQLKAVDRTDKGYRDLAYRATSKFFNLPESIDDFIKKPVDSNGTLNNKALNLMIAMLTNDYVQNNSANNGTTTDPMAEVSNDINKLLAEAVVNTNSKVPEDYLSASDVNGKSIANAKNSAGKAGIGIVANKVQQLTLLLKNNSGIGTPLRANAFKWSIGGKTSNGYMTTVDGNRVMDIMGVLLNVMTDNAKDPIAGNMNLSLQLLNGYTEFLAQGADKYEAALVLNQPAVQLYGKLKQIPNYTLTNTDEDSLSNADKIFKAAIAKTVYGTYDKNTLDKLGDMLLSDYSINLDNPTPVNLNVKQMEEAIKANPELVNSKDYFALQINALIQFRELEKQADNISNLNTYLTLNQGLDISFAELRHNLDKAYDRLSIDKNPTIHVETLPLVYSDALTYGNIKKAEDVLKLGGKIFIEQSDLFSESLKGLEVSLNDSYLNKKKNIKKISRDFLSYVSTYSFKKYLNNIITKETNPAKIEQAKAKLEGLNYSLVYPELGKTISEQLNEFKNSDKPYLRNNALIKYLRPVSKQDDKKGIDYIDGKSFAKESPETLSTLVDGFKELFFDNDPAVSQFAVNLFNYSIIKDNLQFKYGSIMKYLAPGIFHTYSSSLDNINNALNTGDNNSLSDFDTMSYNFRKLFLTYVSNEKNVSKYKSLNTNSYISINGNDIKLDLGKVLNDEKLLTTAKDIFKDNIVNGKFEGFIFPQFYTFNGNVYELKEVNDYPHAQKNSVGTGYRAVYTKLQYQGNPNVSPYSNNTYEDAVKTDSQIAEFKKKQVVINKPEENLEKSQERDTFGDYKPVQEYNVDDYIPKERLDNTESNIKRIDDILNNDPDPNNKIKPCE